ncbi:MAG: T9SS type A sorting domain-containing protein, partial [Bacteroidota bacterium]
TLLDAQADTATVNYYRLREIDQNGGGGFSKTIAVRIEGTHVAPRLQVYPNPLAAGEAIQVELTGLNPFEGQIELFDLTGRELHRQTFEAFQGINVFRVPTDDLTAGNYLLRVRSEHFTQHKHVQIR